MAKTYPTFIKILMILSVIATISGMAYIYIEENNMTFEYTNCTITQQTGGRQGGWVYFEYTVDQKQYKGVKSGSA